jgi:hypothetical protein
MSATWYEAAVLGGKTGPSRGRFSLGSLGVEASWFFKFATRHCGFEKPLDAAISAGSMDCLGSLRGGNTGKKFQVADTAVNPAGALTSFSASQRL